MGLNTPEGLYPLTGVKDLTFDVSSARGVTILDQAIKAAFATGANPVNVFGYSQSAVIASMEMAALNPSNTPGGSLLGAGQVLNFSLVGDVSNPNGGLLPRFPGLKLPSIGLTLFGTATPDNSFPTRFTRSSTTASPTSRSTHSTSFPMSTLSWASSNCTASTRITA